MFLKTFYSICIFSLTVMWNICTVKPCTISITSLLFPTPQTLKSFLCETADYKKKKSLLYCSDNTISIKKNIFNGKQFLFVVPFNLTGSLKCFKSWAVGWFRIYLICLSILILTGVVFELSTVANLQSPSAANLATLQSYRPLLSDYGPPSLGFSQVTTKLTAYPSS